MTLAQREPTDLSEVQTPEGIVEEATRQANVLMQIVNSKHLFKDIEGKRYLEAEAWEIILAFNRAHPVPEWVRPFLEDGEIKGYLARVNIMQNGAVIAAGEMPCGFDDFPCRGKEGTAKHKAAMSAAQTWALSKAARMKFAWVAVLGGYAPTPAEEMVVGRPENKSMAWTSADDPYWCLEHHTRWFKRGKMQAYAHPRGKTEPWCPMPSPTTAMAAKDVADEANVKAVQPMTQEVFEALVAELAKPTTLKILDANAKLLGYTTPQSIRDVIGMASDLVDLEAAQYKLIQKSPLRLRE